MVDGNRKNSCTAKELTSLQPLTNVMMWCGELRVHTALVYEEVATGKVCVVSRRAGVEHERIRIGFALCAWNCMNYVSENKS